MGDKWAAYALVLNDPLGTAISKDPAWETYDVAASVRQAEAAPALPKDLPMAVLSKTEPFPIPRRHEGIHVGGPGIGLDQDAGRTGQAGAEQPPHHRRRQ